MKFWKQRSHDSGDTIVEVLIAVAVISSVLTGAFLVSQKSTSAVRDGQEHSELLQILQGQVELVRSLALKATSATTGVFASSPVYFCIDNSNPAAPVKNGLPALGSSLPAANTDDYAKFSGACRNVQTRYNIAIKYDASTKLFIFTGRWDTVTGIKSEEILKYRIYPGAAPVSVATPAPAGVIDAGAEGEPSTPGAPCYVTKTWLDPLCWEVGLKNTSVNPPGTLDRCVWNWGDGTSTTYTPSSPQCTQGVTFRHQYDPKGSPSTRFTYPTTVTNYSTSGLVRTSTPAISNIVPF